MRDINTLHPSVHVAADRLKALAQERLGLRIIITECLRTAEEQAALYAQGRSDLSRVNAMRAIAKMSAITADQNKRRVTNASTVADSFHGYGLAFDIAVTSPDGKQILWDASSDWNSDGISDWLSVGALASELGLEWGGQWTSFPDIPHYQMTLGKTIAQLKADPNVVAGRTIQLTPQPVAQPTGKRR